MKSMNCLFVTSQEKVIVSSAQPTRDKSAWQLVTLKEYIELEPLKVAPKQKGTTSIKTSKNIK